MKESMKSKKKLIKNLISNKFPVLHNNNKQKLCNFMLEGKTCWMMAVFSPAAKQHL